MLATPAVSVLVQLAGDNGRGTNARHAETRTKRDLERPKNATKDVGQEKTHGT